MCLTGTEDSLCPSSACYGDSAYNNVEWEADMEINPSGESAIIYYYYWNGNSIRIGYITW